MYLTRWNFQNDERVEYVLNKDQIEKLENLIVESDYRKILSSKVSSSDGVRYEIMVKKSEKEVYLIIHTMGGDYITVPHQFDGKFLKIKNPDWKETIEEIISLSK